MSDREIKVLRTLVLLVATINIVLLFTIGIVADKYEHLWRGVEANTSAGIVVSSGHSDRLIYPECTNSGSGRQWDNSIPG